MPELAGRYFEFGDLTAGVERTVRQPVGASLAGPVIRDKYRIGADGFHQHGLEGYLIPPRSHRDPIPILYLILLCEPWMDFEPRIWILIE